jgi:alpha-beta hydrolase superfamily lysophospholipase
MAESILHETGGFRGRGGGTLFCQQWRPAQAKVKAALVLVHGLGEHSSRYPYLVQSLVPAGYAIYGHDHQGFGRSEGQRGHVNRFTEYAADVQIRVAQAREAHPDSPLILFGHSMGGLIALDYLLRYQESVDLAVISAPALLAKTARHLVLLMRTMNLVQPTFVIQRPGGAEGISRDPAEVEKYANDPLWVRTSSARWAVEILSAQADIRPRAGEISLPILLIQGSEDQLVVPEATTSFFEAISSADKSYYYYPGYYHEAHNDVDKEYPLKDLRTWLDARVQGQA